MSLRSFVLALVVAGLAWATQIQQASAANLEQRAKDLLDSRPSRSILVIGNSRTLFNDMPGMLRTIADSAGSSAKFEVESSAIPGATFRDHWDNRRSQALLRERWDDVILQPESGAQVSQQGNEDFLPYGARLGAVIGGTGSRGYLVLGWPYDAALYSDPDYTEEGFGRSDHLALIREMDHKLASKAGLARINVVGPWEAVRASAPSVRLTLDGNHPTVAGTYVYALATYASLSDGPVSAVTYVPPGLSAQDAKTLRDAVDSAPRSR